MNVEVEITRAHLAAIKHAAERQLDDSEADSFVLHLDDEWHSSPIIPVQEVLIETGVPAQQA